MFVLQRVSLTMLHTVKVFDNLGSIFIEYGTQLTYLGGNR